MFPSEVLFRDIFTVGYSTVTWARKEMRKISSPTVLSFDSLLVFLRISLWVRQCIECQFWAWLCKFGKGGRSVCYVSVVWVVVRPVCLKLPKSRMISLLNLMLSHLCWRHLAGVLDQSTHDAVAVPQLGHGLAPEHHRRTLLSVSHCAGMYVSYETCSFFDATVTSPVSLFFPQLFRWCSPTSCGWHSWSPSSSRSYGLPGRSFWPSWSAL